MAELRRHRLLDHTLVIIASDHGENIGEHGLMSHAYSLHDTLIRVPLIMRYPERFPAGQRVTQQVQLTDLFPTILDVLQLHLPAVRKKFRGQPRSPQVCSKRRAASVRGNARPAPQYAGAASPCRPA